ncbi:hypothetical protein [Halorubrum sp. ARQ200]|uniref:hypothetical protein n=1 Tax=Halorubrum sp. ARQ200 TaxID=1855872 RepID=UPI0010F87315|nr:hypothetical protein [Halorubrum sp. ARQ200]TKX46070.1 hypothetical protein EXE50_02405 [Halorubrum sp. ARQ200]
MSDSRIPLDEDRLEYLIDLQHQRYYHIQTLARGILGTIIAIAAILATLVASFYRLFPPFIGDLEAYSDVAGSLGISLEAALSITILNYLLAYVFLFLTIVTAIIISVRLADIVLGYPLMPQREVDTDYSLRFSDGRGNTGEYSIFLYKSFMYNGGIVNKSYDRLISSGLRTVLLLGFILGGVVVYINLSEQNIFEVLLYNSGILVVTIVFPVVSEFLVSKPDETPRSESSIAQEMFHEHSPSSRWKRVQTKRSERLLILLGNLISILAVLIYGVSRFF